MSLLLLLLGLILINYYTVWKRALLRVIAAYGVNYEHVATATEDDLVELTTALCCPMILV